MLTNDGVIFHAPMGKSIQYHAKNIFLPRPTFICDLKQEIDIFIIPKLELVVARATSATAMRVRAARKVKRRETDPRVVATCPESLTHKAKNFWYARLDVVSISHEHEKKHGFVCKLNEKARKTLSLKEKENPATNTRDKPCKKHKFLQGRCKRCILPEIQETRIRSYDACPDLDDIPEELEDVEVSAISEIAPQLDPVHISGFVEEIQLLQGARLIEEVQVAEEVEGAKEITPTSSKGTKDDSPISTYNTTRLSNVSTKATSTFPESATGVSHLHLKGQINIPEPYRLTGDGTPCPIRFPASDEIQQDKVTDANDLDIETFGENLNAQAITPTLTQADVVTISRRKFVEEPVIERITNHEEATDSDLNFRTFEDNLDPSTTAMMRGRAHSATNRRRRCIKEPDMEQTGRPNVSKLHKISDEGAVEKPELKSLALAVTQSPTISVKSPNSSQELALMCVNNPPATPTTRAYINPVVEQVFNPTIPVTAANMIQLRFVPDLLSPVIEHMSGRIRDKFCRPIQKLENKEIELSLYQYLNSVKTSAHIAGVVMHYRSDFSNPEDDIIEGLVRGAVFGDEKCQSLLLEIHGDCLSRLDAYFLRARRALRRGYLMIDLYCLANAQFTNKDIVDGIQRKMFYAPTDSLECLDDSVFASFIYHAVRTGVLPKTSAVQALLLVTACDSDQESEVEKAVFEDKELFGPEGYIYTNDGKVMDRPLDSDVYENFAAVEDLAAAPKTLSEIKTRARDYTSELEQYVVGDQRSGAFGSSQRSLRNEYRTIQTPSDSSPGAKHSTDTDSPLTPSKKSKWHGRKDSLSPESFLRGSKRLVVAAKRRLRRRRSGREPGSS